MGKYQQVILMCIFFLSSTLYANTPTTPNAVVKVFATLSLPDYEYPWQTSKISKFTGSGAIIEGNKILTSAHVVSSARLIEVKKENDPTKYIATVKYISHQADLAILELKDKTFFDSVNPLKLSDDIKARDEVTVLGYPLGGNSISTTTGVISRIEYRSYAWGGLFLLAIQIDAAINSGNSGGPVVNDKNELVGIAMMKLTKSSNIGYIVPTAVIDTFLEDTKDGAVNGFHQDTVLLQITDNHSIKELYGLEGKTGILIIDTGKDEKILKVGDILLSVDDKAIANNGTIETQYGHIDQNMELHTKQIGQSVKYKILRDKKEMLVEYPIKKVTPLIYRELGKEPRYMMYGGFVFTPATKNYLSEIDQASYVLNMLLKEKSKDQDYKEPVAIMSTIFPDKANRGYQTRPEILDTVNGVKIKSFDHLVEVLDGMEDEFTIFDFLGNKKIVLKTKEAKESTKRIMEIYNLKSARRVE